MQHLIGTTAFITGGAGGIGRDIAARRPRPPDLDITLDITRDITRET